MKISIAVERIEAEEGAEGLVVHTPLLVGVWETPEDIRPGEDATLVLPLDRPAPPTLLLLRWGEPKVAVLEQAAEDDADPGT